MVGIGTWLDRRLGGPLLGGSVRAQLHAGDASIQGLRDLATFRTFLTGPSIFPLLDAPWTPLFLGVIMLLHPLLGWIAVAGAVVLFALALANDLATRRPLALAGGAAIQALHQAEAAVRNADAIEAMGMLPRLIDRWERQSGRALALQARASRRAGGITALSKFIRLVLQIGILGAGAWLVIGSAITPGAMIAASILMGRALAPVEQAISAWRSALGARGAYGRIHHQLATEPPPAAAMPLPQPRGQLSVEAVTYLHPNAHEPVLRNVSLVVAPGEALGLVGPSAAGKTTLARLMIGNLKPRAGHVRLDGMDMAVWPSSDRGQYLGYLPQDVELFSGSVRDNISRLGGGETGSVVAAARLAGVHDMILRLPLGYETEIGIGGTALSGGERQRIALARALYGEPRLVVLDEPSASLDQPGEAALLAAMAALKARGVTVVIVAHRPGILRHVDRVLVLRAGLVQRLGPRDEILGEVTRPRAPPVAAGASPRPEYQLQ